MTKDEHLDAIDNRCAKLLALAEKEPQSFMESAVCAFKATRAAIKGLREECKEFRFPDEDRPACHNALNAIMEAWPIETLSA